MGIATYSYNRSTSGGEIIRELVNASDGQGLHFDGAAGNIDIASPPDLGTKFSFEFIAQADSWADSAYKYLVDFGTGGRFVIGTDVAAGAKLAIYDNSSWKTFGVAPLDDLEVHHLVVTIDGTAAILYDNGNQVATVTISASHGIGSCTDARIAGIYNSTGNFNGTMYRCRFWNKTLSQAEVTASYENATVPFADQYGSQTYIIDSSFASSTQSFNGVGGTTAANIDGIGGQNDTLRFTTDSATTNHQIQRTCPRDLGKNVRVQGMVYIPSSNTNIKKVQINEDGNADVAVIKEITTLDSWVSFDEIHVWTNYDELRFRGLKADGTSNYAGNGSDVFYIKNIKVNNAGCVADYDLAFANPTQSLMVQDRAGAADGTSSATGVTQVTPIEQLNSKSARIGTSAATPADGELVAKQIRIGDSSATTVYAHLESTTRNQIKVPNDSSLEFWEGGNQNLTIDPYGNVGIGTSAPSSFHANASNLVVGAGAGTEGVTINSGSSSYGVIYFAAGTVGSAAYAGNIGYNHSDNSMRFGTNGSTTDVVISSAGDSTFTGNVGVGVTPTAPIHIDGGGVQNSTFVRFSNSNTTRWDVGSDIAGLSSHEFAFYSQSAAKNVLTISSAGTVGVGVTPETDWDSAHSALQIGLTGSVVSGTATNGWTQVMKNARYVGGGVYKYITTDEASSYQQKNDGSHNFAVAASGTADAAITWTDALTIDSAGAVTMPSTPAFSATPSAAQDNLAVAPAVVDIVLGTEIFDQGANFASNTFTAPVAGRYQLNAILGLVYIDSAADFYQVQIATSNRTYTYTYDPDFGQDAVYWEFGPSVLADMDASDTAVMRFYQSGGTAQTDVATARTYFNGYLAC